MISFSFAKHPISCACTGNNHNKKDKISFQLPYDSENLFSFTKFYYIFSQTD